MEALIKNTTERVLQHCPDEMSQFHKRWGEAPKHEVRDQICVQQKLLLKEDRVLFQKSSQTKTFIPGDCQQCGDERIQQVDLHHQQKSLCLHHYVSIQ